MQICYLSMAVQHVPLINIVTPSIDIKGMYIDTEIMKIPYFSYEKVKLALYPLWINAE